MRIYVYLFIVILIFNNIHIRILTLKWQLHGVQRGSSLYKDLPNIRELRIASVDRLYIGFRYINWTCTVPFLKVFKYILSSLELGMYHCQDFCVFY